MDSYSSIFNEEKNKNRSDPSAMNNIDQIRLARLRPEKFDDVAVKHQISIIQQACEGVDPEIIALVFHECDYNMQKTIARIKAGEFQDGGWQTAKSTNKKKTHSQNNHHAQADQLFNGGTLSDSERSASQRTSPTSSLRGGYRRNDRHPYPAPIRTDARRRGTDPGRNQFNSRHSTRTNPTHRSAPPIPSETSLPPQQSIEDIPQIAPSLVDEYEFVDGRTQSLTFDNSQKTVPSQPSPKHLLPSAIPHEPVSMHPAIQFSPQPIDIQFGDIQWQGSVPIAVNPSREIATVLDHDEEELSSIVDTNNQDIHDTLSTNYIIHQPTNDTDNQLLEATTSLSIIDHTMSNNIPVISPETTSHLSDHLTNALPSIPNQYSSQLQEPVQIPITRLPPTSTPRAPEYTSPTSQFITNNVQQSNTNATSSAFTPFNRLGNYPSIPREYSQATNWNPPSSHYKATPKPTMIPAGTYPQQQPSYQLSPQQQQQVFFRTYPYAPLSPAVVQVFAPVEHWPSTGFPTPLESYPYPPAGYIPSYSNPQQYHPPTKYEQPIVDKEFFAHYGQPRSSNTDPSYQQQQTSASSQPAQDTPAATSKLSPTAATFSQGASLTGSPSATAVYLNPVTLSMPNYYPSMGGTAHQDRTLSYSSVDNRDNRNGANNRPHYYHYGQQQQQRTHNNNVSNSTWHGQQ